MRNDRRAGTTGFGRAGRCCCLAVLAVVAAAGAPAGASQEPGGTVLLTPEAFTDTAPSLYRAVFDTSIGIFIVQVRREWAPRGADRFYNLVKRGFYDDNRFFRVVPDFVAQFGIHGDPAVSAAWAKATIPDDRPRQSNTRGKVTFAMMGPGSRATQVFINFGNNSKLDLEGFAPFGEVVTSMVMVERLFDKYGEGPDQSYILKGGNAFLQQYMPQLDYIKKATIETQ